VNTDGLHSGQRINPRIGALRRFATERRQSAPGPEQCELCSVKIGEPHRHLLEVENRRILCACDSCALRFDGVVGGRFALIPRDAVRLAGFRLADEQWNDWSLPIELAFVFRSSSAERVVALYPSPAGAVESLLTLKAWDRLVTDNPVLSGMKPDVEALLLNRRGAQRDYFIAPIDACFTLVGLLRQHWTGLSGGSEVWREIDGFFTRLAPSSLAAAPAEVPCA
jgi:hypothetical protein